MKGEFQIVFAQVKHKNLWIFLMIVVGLTAFIGEGKSAPPGFTLITENEHLELYMKESTTEIAVLVKESGDIWYSNPANRQTMETMARGTAKDRLNSQIVIEYYVGNQQFTMDNYNDSVVYDQHRIIPIENGVRVEYSFGKTWVDKDYLPLVISKDRFDEYILGSFEDEADREFIRDQYGLFTLEHGYEDPDKISILGVDFEKLFGEYGVKVEEPSFRANDKRRLIQEYLLAVRDYKEYASLGAIKTEDIKAVFDTPTYMRKWNIMIWDEEELIELMKSSNYTPDMIIEEHLHYNVTPPTKNLRIFSVAVEYFLDGTDLIARIPGDSYKYPDKVFEPGSNKNVTYPLTSIALLRYFGAADSETQGYIIVPDGCGALINFNNGKANALPYSGDVYGRDYTMAPIVEYTINLETQVYLPIFGAKQQDKAFLAIIESGDAIARLSAEVAGMRDSYNKVWASFSTIPNVRVHMLAEGEQIGLRRLAINMYQSRHYQDDMSIRYCFLNENHASYAGMARHYQEYLADRYNLTRLGETTSIPMLLEIIGGIEKIEPVLGVSRKTIKPITTFSQVESIIEQYLNRGIDQLTVRYSGWLKGGLDHIFPTKISLENKLGTEQQFAELIANLQAKNIDFYPNLSLINVYKNSIFDDFIGFRDTARFLNRKVAILSSFDISTYLPLSNQEFSLLSPAQFPRVVDSFLASYLRFDHLGLSLDSLGRQLYADYRVNPDNLINRQQSKEIVVDQLTKIKEHRLSLMSVGTNVYMLPFTDFIVGAPSYSRNYEIIDYSIPFYQMVMRSYINYAGEPGNLAQRPADYMLKLLETGAVPYYMLCYADAVEIKASQFDRLFSINHDDHFADIVSMYNTVNQILQPLWHQRIVDHTALAVDVYRTTYEGGTSIIVNYNSNSVNVLDMEVPGHGYRIITGGEHNGEK